MNSFYKRRFALLIAISVAVTVALTVAAAFVGVNMFGYDFEGEGTEQSPYLISSDADMKALSIMSSTSDGADTEGKYYRLTRDVKVYGAKRTQSVNGFAGVFDGDGHSVEIIGAMFNNLADTAVIKNATLRLDSRVRIDDDFADTKASYISHHGGEAKIENVTVDCDLVIEPEAGTGRNDNTPTLYTLIRSSNSVEFHACTLDIDISIRGGRISNRTVMLYALKHSILRDSSVDLTIRAEFGSSSPWLDLSSNASGCRLDYTLELIDRADKDYADKFKYKDYTFDEAFSYSGYSIVFGSFYQGNDYKLGLNMIYRNRTDCFKTINHDYHGSPTVDVDFALSIDASEVETFTKDGFVFAERGDELFLLEYIGDDEDATVPSFGGKYSAYSVCSFAFYNKHPKRVIYPAEITAIGSKPYADDLSAVVFRGTTEQYKKLDTGYNRPMSAFCQITCSDGTYRYL